MLALPAGERWPRLRGRAWAFPAGVALVALAVRLAMLVRSGWLLEGDDSLSTLMGLAILDGLDRPIMLKNQTYAAAWEPYLMAVSFALFGVSRVSAKLPELATSLAVVWAVWLLAREVAGDLAARFAALLAAVPPVYVLVLSLKPWAPYTEVILLGTLCLHAATRLAFSPPLAHRRPWAAWCGAVGGLAFWMHPIAVFYLLPVGLLVLARLRGRALAEASLLGAAGFGVGALPVWLYNLQTGGATLAFVSAGAGRQAEDRWLVLQAWANADLPRALGLWNPWAGHPRSLALLTGALLTAAVVGAVWRRMRVLRPLDLLLVFMAGVPLLFVLSGFGGPALNPWGFDATGRYAPPVWFGACVLLGAFLARVWSRQRLLAASLLALALANALLGQARTDAALAFQSPYWAKLPVDSRALLDVLREGRLEYVYLNHWAAFPVMFDARARGQPLIAYDWYDVQAGGIDRFPEYLPRVVQADRPAFVLVTDEPEPELEQLLRQLGVTYEKLEARPYVVIVPTTRRVHPSEVTPALDYRY